MAANKTFTMIKPDAVAENHIGGITKMIEEGGFRVVAMKKTQLTEERAGKFYEVHKERPFYGDLVKYMSSGPIVAMILEKDNAVEDFRKLIGATNPAQAEEGTVRYMPSLSKQTPFMVPIQTKTPRSKAISSSLPTSVSSQEEVFKKAH
jgi:nucleoside-diphosphate kinase